MRATHLYLHSDARVERTNQTRSAILGRKKRDALVIYLIFREYRKCYKNDAIREKSENGANVSIQECHLG